MKFLRPFYFLLSLSALLCAQLVGETASTTDPAPPPAPPVSAAAPAGKDSSEVTRPAAVAPHSDPDSTADDPEAATSADPHELTSSAEKEAASPSANEKPQAPEVPEVPRALEKPTPPQSQEHDGNSNGNAVVTFGDAYLAVGNSADAVVAILGSAETHGEVHQAVVAVLGNSSATENVGEAVVAVLGNAETEKNVGEDVVAVLGDARANGHVQGNVVAVLGNVDLGSGARIDGDVVSIGGTVNRAPGAEVYGRTNQLAFLRHVPLVPSLGYWFQQTIGQGRLLAFRPRLGGAWGTACAFLVLYLLIALAFDHAVTKCAETLEQRPGRVVLTAFLSFLVAPLLMIPLAFTIVGLVVFLVALIAALLVGKAAFLAWLGRRLGGTTAKTRVALAVLIGGILSLFIYVVPIAGLLFWSIGTALGFGLAIQTALTGMRRDRALRSTASPVSPPAMALRASPIVPPVSATAIPPLPPSPAAAMPPPLRQMDPVPSVSAPVSTMGLPRAGFWIRLAASGLDVVLVGMLGRILHLGDFFPLLFTAYCVAMWALRATTIGGIVCGLKIVRLDDRAVDWPVALVRVLGGFLSLCVAGLGFMWVAFDPEMQSWHDRIAGTTIVRLPKGTPLI